MTHLAVLSASLLQFLLAATFIAIGIAGRVRGPAAQLAAEADVAQQGLTADLLAHHRINFGATRSSVAVAVAIGLSLAALGALVLAGDNTGRILTWIFQPVVLILGAVIMPGEVFTTRYIQAAFRKADDPELRDIDIPAFVSAAAGAYPTWLRPATVARLILATAGSAAVIVLLTPPLVGSYFK